MLGRALLGSLAATAVRRPRLVIALCLAVAAAGAVIAMRLPTDAGTDTLVDADDETFRATEEFKEQFGDDAVVILVEGDLRKLVLTKNLGTLLELEACLAGGTPVSLQLPRRQEPLPEVCDKIAELGPSRVVFGPATFLFQAITQIENVLRGQVQGTQQQAKLAARRAAKLAAQEGLPQVEQRRAAQAAAAAVIQQFQDDLVRLALRYDITKLPRLDDPDFVSRVVFDQRQAAGTPKARFAYLFPNSGSALISIRLRPELSDSERREAIDLVRDTVGDERFSLEGGRYVVSGVPAVVAGLAESLRSEIFLLLGAAVVVMAVCLLFVLWPPLRLVPLGVALAASGLAFGLLAALGGSLTMASIAVLPVLIGLAVDYAIQFQARFAEARGEGAAPPDAALIAAARGGPIIATAVLATAAGFAALALSPVPMVRAFGLLLVVGVILAFLVALTAGLAVLSLTGRPDRRRLVGTPAAARRLEGRLARMRRRTGTRLRTAGQRSLAVAIAAPGRVLVAALALAVCGWIAGTQTPVVSDIRDLASSDLPAMRDVSELQEQTGVSGELNVRVRSDDLADPDVITWMRDFQQRVLERHGFGGDFPSCQKAEICPAVSLTDLFTNPAGGQTRERVQGLLDSIPPYFSQAVVTRDPETGAIGDTANIAFGMRVMPLDEQEELIDDIRAQIDPPEEPGPPVGTEAEVTGLPALAAEANGSLSASRYWLPLAGLLAVGLALAAAYRSMRRAVIPLVPIALATGWSALVVAAMDIPLNPMSATLGALVIAIATEFSVILSARYEEERGQGASVGEALRRTYERTGTAVIASGTTAIAGFAVLAVTDIRMLRDFGLVTVADLTVALIGVMLVLPAALVWAEEGAPLPLRSRRAQPEPAGG